MLEETNPHHYFVATQVSILFHEFNQVKKKKKDLRLKSFSKGELANINTGVILVCKRYPVNITAT